MPAHLMVAQQVEEQKKEEPKKQLPFNGAPIGTVINTIKANTPAGQDPVYPEGYEPKHPTEKQVAECARTSSYETQGCLLWAQRTAGE